MTGCESAKTNAFNAAKDVCKTGGFTTCKEVKTVEVSSGGYNSFTQTGGCTYKSTFEVVK
jgi:hypothetical protein